MRGAAFSGGGFYGNVIVGMLQRISEDDDFEPWGCMTGISTGALIENVIAQYPKSRFKDAIQKLTGIYTPRVTEDIHRRWFMGKMAALWKPSLRNTAALRGLIDELSNNEAIRTGDYRTAVGVVNLEQGYYEAIGHDYIPFNKAVEASASLPAFFEPVRVPEHGLCVDGGAAVGCDIGTLIKMGCTEIDAFIAMPEKLAPKFMPDPEALDVALRTFEVMVHTALWQQVKMTRIYNQIALGGDQRRKYIKLRVFAPDRLVGDGMEFVPSQAIELQEIGRSAASEVLHSVD